MVWEKDQPGASYVEKGEDYDAFGGQHREVIDGLTAIKDALLLRPTFPPILTDLSDGLPHTTQRKFVIRKIVFGGPFTLNIGTKLFPMDAATLNMISIDFPMIVERGISIQATNLSAQHCYVFGDMIED